MKGMEIKIIRTFELMKHEGGEEGINLQINVV